MNPPKNIAADIDRLGQHLGLQECWTYLDVHSQAAAASALQQWALLRELREWQLAQHPSATDAA